MKARIVLLNLWNQPFADRYPQMNVFLMKILLEIEWGEMSTDLPNVILMLQRLMGT
jgi:hypothetical protein